MSSDLVQSLLRIGGQPPPAAPSPLSALVNPMQLAAVLMGGKQSGQYSPEGRFTELGGAPGGYSSVTDLLGRAKPGLFGFFKNG